MTETGDVAPALDFSAFDHGVRVQDDLFRHVNGTWLANAEIPADKPLTGAFMNLRDHAEEAVRDIITTIEADSGHPDEAKIADLYASFMDADAVEALGAAPLSPLFAAIDAVTLGTGARPAARPVRPQRGRRPGRRGHRVRPG